MVDASWVAHETVRLMRTLSTRWSAVLMLAGVTASLSAPKVLAQEDVRPAVTAAVQVTQNPDPARAHSSPQIAVNPKTNELVIVENDMRNKRTCDAHLSVDDGRSWSDGGSLMKDPYVDCAGDPISSVNFTLTFDPEGVLYVAFTAHDPSVPFERRADRPRHVFLARSTDSGRTFQTNFVYEAPENVQNDPRTSNRRPMVAVDPSDNKYVYVTWMQPQGTGKKDLALLAGSVDGGRSFSAPIDLGPDQGAYQPRVAVDRNGTVHVAMHGRGFATPTPNPPLTRPLTYRRSNDHGKTFSPPKEIDPGNAGFSFGRKALIAADPTSDRLYVSWYGNPNPRATRPAAGEPPSPAFDDRDIYLRVSPDGGETWSEAKLINDDASQPMVQHYDPGLSVAPNGRVDIAWLDFRNSPTPEGEASGGNDGGFNDVYYSYSTDGGQTFKPNIRITDRSIDRRIGVWSNNQHSHAYVGVASTEDSVYFTWQDTRNGNPDFQAEDVYFASVKHTGTALPIVNEDDDVPAWLLVTSGVAIGLGVAIVLSLAVFRRRARA